MGTRLDEQLIVHELLSNRVGQMPHIFVGDQAACDELTQGRMAVTEATHLVVARAYPNPDGRHEALIPLAEYLARPPLAKPIPDQPLAPISPIQPDEHYVRPTLIPVRGDEEEQVAAFMFAAGTREALGEDELRAVGSRVLLVGRPGSGKSTLMREVAKGHGPDVRPLHVPLSRVDVVGEPSLLLERWARSSSGMTGDEPVGDAALSQRVFHFFLDGLDEVSPARQAALADKIVQVARAHPMHMFTVASRPVEATDRFLAPEWRQVSILPGLEWQQEYLAARGVSWDELEAELPLLRDLRGLMELPFFLAAVVELHARERLSGPRDLLDIVGMLLGAALAEADLPLPPDELRAWLRRVALAMQLSTRTEIRVDELSAVPLPVGLEETGDPREIAEMLINARAFVPLRAGGYAFLHRIFGEALVAEAVVGYAPWDHGLLDVIAPRVSDALAGVRGDWLVPVTLVASRDHEWRQALTERDPLAAARAVPPDAPLDERRQAARLIWSTYVEWRVWIWGWSDMPTLMDDAVALARLLMTEGLGEERAEIMAAAESPVREIRGNAFRVLSLIGERAVEVQLRAVLEDDDEDPVLRRTAGRAAARMNPHSLLDIIRHRATTSADAEAQDMTYYALGLTTDEELLPLLLELAAARTDAMYIAVGAVERRLAPRDQLRVLHVWAGRATNEIESIKQRAIDLLPDLPVEADAVRELAFVAGAWTLRGDNVRAYLTQMPHEAAEGLVEALRAGAAYDYEVVDIAAWLPLSTLHEAGASADLLRWSHPEEE
jgi:hypothetical protein